ncbi:transcription factor GTE9-like [Phalaenopsis equestris]|uniref:transcription factor GTE9-like n=1 Tax=Phalaenopsis equestris TaxID=78828 RepID=UPI0009E37730|nr:transcription factor GTE9-like [Phalaenopsis equestris]
MASLMTSSCNYNQLCRRNTFNRASLSGLGEPQLSPRKAFRVAMLKNRFADIIFKAQETLNIKRERKGEARMEPKKGFIGKPEIKKRRFESQVNGYKNGIIEKTNSKLKANITLKNDSAIVPPEKEKINRAEMQYEKEDFTEKEQTKKRKIAVRTETAKLDIDKVDLEHKMKIEKEREAARLELEKVEASIYIDDFNHTHKEFMVLICSQSNGSNV